MLKINLNSKDSKKLAKNNEELVKDNETLVKEDETLVKLIQFQQKSLLKRTETKQKASEKLARIKKQVKQMHQNNEKLQVKNELTQKNEKLAQDNKKFLTHVHAQQKIFTKLMERSEVGDKELCRIKTEIASLQIHLDNNVQMNSPAASEGELNPKRLNRQQGQPIVQLFQQIGNKIKESEVGREQQQSQCKHLNNSNL